MDINYSLLKPTKPEIRLRTLTMSDAQDIYKNVKDKAVVRWIINIPHPYHLSDAREFIKKSIKAWKDKTTFTFGIELKDTKQIVGVISLSKIDKKNKNCELGYWLGKKYWNQGIMSLAVSKVLDFAFNKLKLHRVYSRTFADNTASLRVLENNNFLLEGILYETYWRNGNWHNIFIYGLLKNEYQKLKC